MAIADLHPMFTGYRGRMGKLVHYDRRGTHCVRRHVVPRNPDTAAQKAVRAGFREAVHAWQALPASEKDIWNHKARYKPLTGYNLFVSWFIRQNHASASLRLSSVHAAVPSISGSFQPCIHSVIAAMPPAECVHYGHMRPVSPGTGL